MPFLDSEIDVLIVFDEEDDRAKWVTDIAELLAKDVGRDLAIRC